MGEAEAIHKQDSWCRQPKNMKTKKTKSTTLNPPLAHDAEETRINGSNIRIKYYEDLGWAPVIPENPAPENFK